MSTTCFFCVAQDRACGFHDGSRPITAPDPIPARKDSPAIGDCLGCWHPRSYHTREDGRTGYCTHPRSINPCHCAGGYGFK